MMISNDSISGLLLPPKGDVLDDFAQEVDEKELLRRMFGGDEAVMIGRYRVDKRIGHGGMGDVYSAYDPELERKVAIKRVRSHSSPTDRGDALRTALLRDARSAARIKHPHVVEIYDCVIHDDQLHVVMELVEGPNLREWLSCRARSWREIVEVFIQAGEGLASAHLHGVVHRDFKPSNVLVGRDGRARVADFGLARIVGDIRETEPEGDDLLSSGTQTIAGTLPYMAPEQHRGRAVTSRADQFSYCVALYRALFRELPFEGDTAEQYTSNVLNGGVRRPTARHGAPRALVSILMRGLAEGPQDRYRSMEHIIARLHSVVLRRKRIALGGTGVVLLACTALVSHWGRSAPCPAEELWTSQERSELHDSLVQRSWPPWVAEQTMTTLDELSRGWAEARQDTCVATRVLGEQSDELMDLRIACLERQRVSLSSITARLSAPDGPEGELGLELIENLAPASDCDADIVREKAKKAQPFRKRTDRSAAPQLESTWSELTARLAEARVDIVAARYDQAHQRALEVAEIAQSHGMRYLQAEALWIQGDSGLNEAINRMQRTRAREALTQALALAVSSGADRLASEVALTLASAQPHWHRPDVLEIWLALASAHADTLPDPGTLPARIEMVRGTLAMERGRFADASASYRRALLDVEDGSQGSTTRNLLADALRHSGDLAEAKKIWEELHQDVERRDRTHPLFATTFYNLSLVAEEQDRLADALELLVEADRAYVVGRATDPREHQECVITRSRILRKLDRFEEARELLAGVLRDVESEGLSSYHIQGKALDELGEVERGSGNAADALKVAEKQLTLAIEYYEREEHLEVMRSRVMLAEAYLELGDVERAHTESERVYRALLEERPTLVRAQALFVSARVAHSRGDWAIRDSLLLETYEVLAAIPESDLYSDAVRQWARTNGLEDDEGG